MVKRCCDNCEFEDGEFVDGYRKYYACRNHPDPFWLKNFKPENGCKMFKPLFYLADDFDGEQYVKEMKEIERCNHGD